MKTMSQYCREQYGEKLYKLCLNGGMTCPNRDGTCGTEGCIFCSEGGSGDFGGDPTLSIVEQIEQEKKRVAGKYAGSRYIAYFQAFTNTYGSIEHLREIYLPTVQRDDIAVLSIATRPDCLGEEVLALLSELNEIKPVWVELGLQTSNEKTADLIRRGYDLGVYLDAVDRLKKIEVHVITHVILGLPGESLEDMLSTVRCVRDAGSDGIKLQLLHVLKGTRLEEMYSQGEFTCMSLEEYVDCVLACLREIPEKMVVHRLTGDGPKRLLVAPLWSGNKKHVLNTMYAAMRQQGIEWERK